MRNTTLHKLIWVLIYGGMFGFALGLFMQQRAAPGEAVIAVTLMAAGALAAAIGAVGIWWRSRRVSEPRP